MQLNLDLSNNMKTRRQYTHGFKQMAIERSNNCENIRALAEELGIRPEILYRWRKEALKQQIVDSNSQTSLFLTVDYDEIFKLLKELKKVEEERDTYRKMLNI